MRLGLTLLSLLWIGIDGKPGSKVCFNEDFAFGVSTAAYQIEGAWKANGKGESIWDRYTHEHPERVFDHRNGDVAADSYRRYKEDVAMLREIGASFYRLSISWPRIMPTGISKYAPEHLERVFDHRNGDVAADSYRRYKEDVAMLREIGASFYRLSISWPRIMPTGISNDINDAGVRYYENLLLELQKHNIQALVTMYHWDLPQSLQDLGGWTNPIIVDYFADYASFLFDRFGHLVKGWITFNEPLSFCGEGYGGLDAPGRQASGFEDYLCAHNVLKAHGRVYRIYKKYFDKLDQGYIGISLDVPWLEPATTAPANKTAAETARQFLFGWFAHPIFSKQGDYPPIMRRRIDNISKLQGFPRSRLPTFTKFEVLSIRGSADFLGLNHYTTNLVAPGDGRISEQPNYYNDIGVRFSLNPEWPTSNSTWLRVVPWGFRKMLNWVKNTYDNPKVVVTENGISLPKGLRDVRRVAYIDSYLRAMHAAIHQDKCDVIAYTYWSLMDNFEWMRGYSERFGLYEVDFGSRNLTRTPRQSAGYFASVSKTSCLPDKKDWDQHE